MKREKNGEKKSEKQSERPRSVSSDYTVEHVSVADESVGDVSDVST